MTNLTENSVFNNVYGLARSLIALSNLATILLTNPYHQFDKSVYNNIIEDWSLPNVFFVFGYDNLWMGVFLASIILLWVISGYLPQVSGILHAWVIYSFFNGALLVEGGDQISQIAVILLIPVCIFDRRLNHWSNKNFFKYQLPEWIAYFCYTCIVMIQFQISFLYFFAVADKVPVTEWRTGTAVYYWVNENMFGANEIIKPLITPLINSQIFSPLLTWLVLLFEFILASAIFMTAKSRKILFIPAILFHLSIVFIHGLTTFFLAMAGVLVLYLLPVRTGISFEPLQKIHRCIRKGQALVPIFLTAFFLISCDSDKTDNILDNRNDSVVDSIYSITKGVYFWQDRLPNPDDFFSIHEKESMTPIEVMFNIRKYSPTRSIQNNIDWVDKWSSVVTNAEWDMLLTGQTGDFGLGMNFISDEDLRISWIQRNSIGKALLSRGDRVTSINGINCTTQNTIALTNLLQTSNKLLLTVLKNGEGTSETITLPRENYQFDPIIDSKIIRHNGRNIGYVNIISFTDNLKSSVERLKGDRFFSSIDELIIDLRYNSGGLIPEMENLANTLAPSTAENKLMYETVHNENINFFNFRTVFRRNETLHDIEKLTFITTRNTASASEMLIDVLKPYCKVKIVGTETAGKLMGMYPLKFREFTLIPVSFLTVNSNGILPEPGVGFTPDIYCKDDMKHDFTIEEECIKTAITQGKSLSKRTLNMEIEYLPIQEKLHLSQAILLNPKL